MPPRVPRQAGTLGQEALAVQEAVRSWAEQGGRLPPLLGAVQPVKIATYHARSGEIVPCDTSSGTFTLWLPKVSRDRVGQFVYVVALGAVSGGVLLSNALTVQPADADATIAGSASISMTVVNTARLFFAISRTKWMSI